MRGVRFTKAEVAYLQSLMDLPGSDKLKGTIRAKLTAASATVAPGVAAGPLEKALVDAARGKVVPVEPSSYPRVSRMATAVGATPALAATLGQWIASQKWLQGPLTIFTVLSKWPDWAARAKATAAPDGLEEGIAADVGRGAQAKRPASTAGRRAPGIG